MPFDLSLWLANLLSVALLAAVWAFVFERRTLARPVNLLYFAALCVPFAEVLTVKAGMRLIATDWIALVLLAGVLLRWPWPRLATHQVVGTCLAASLGLLPFLALPFFQPGDVTDATRDFDPSRAAHLPHASTEFYLTYGVQAVRWMQQCALIMALLAMVRTEKRWETVVDWAIVGSTINCAYGLYQMTRYWWGWVDLPLLPFTYGRHTSAHGYARATGFMWEPTVFGSFTALVLLLVLYRLLRSAPSKRLWAILVLHVAALVLSFSAIGIIAALAGWTMFLLLPAADWVRRIPMRHAARVMLASAVACGVVALLMLSPGVRKLMWGTSGKLVTIEGPPSSRVQREQIMSDYQAALIPRSGTLGIGIGQMLYVSGGALPLPLKVLAEQGLVGLMLFLSLGGTVAWHIWRCRRTHATRTVLATALLACLSVVVGTQGQSKINFIFFFAGLLLALPSSSPVGRTMAAPALGTQDPHAIIRGQRDVCGS